MIVGIFEARRRTKARGAQSDDSWEDGGFEASKTTTAMRVATPKGLGPIPVTVDTFEAYGGGGG